MTVEQLQQKISLFRDGVKQMEAQIQQMQNNRIATMGAIEAFEMLSKEMTEATEATDANISNGSGVDSSILDDANNK